MPEWRAPIRYDLRDLTVVIPIRFDSERRRKNLRLVVRYLLRWFDVRIAIGEQETGESHHVLRGLEVEHVRCTGGGELMHRTRMLNELVEASRTEYLAIYDADVLVHPRQLVVAMRALRQEGCDLVLPYEGRCLDIPESMHEEISRTLSVDGIDPSRLSVLNEQSVGGAVLVRRECYLDAGMENEAFVGWGPEDQERITRFQRLDFRLGRVTGALYHLSHPRTHNSDRTNPSFANNERELQRIDELEREALAKEVSTWPWVARAKGATSRAEPGSSPPLRIVAWTQSDWAFGRIARDLQKYLGQGFELSLLDWATFHPEEAFHGFDLVYIPIWDHALKFRSFYPTFPPERICFSIHCRAELFHYDIARRSLVTYDQATIERCEIAPELLGFLREQRVIGVISPDLFELLQNRYGLTNLRSTIIGVDSALFSAAAARREDEPLVVIHTLPRRGIPVEAHGYDAKRSWIVAEAEERLAQERANVRFVFAESRLSLDAMPDFYRGGDVHVCVSHAEGLPTVGLESLACGLAQISTPVGIMPGLLGDGKAGFLLREREPRRIVDELCSKILELDRDRGMLRGMKLRASALRGRLGWERRINAWRSFFLEAAGRDERREAASSRFVADH